MKNSIFAQAANFIRERRDNRRWRTAVICLAVVVVFATVLGLINKGQALTRAEDVLDCKVVVHKHDADCYDGNGNLICKKADFVFHTHDDSCYDADGELACQLPEIEEHVHTDACFAVEEILICKEEETAGTEKAAEGEAAPAADAVSVENADAVTYEDEGIAVYADAAGERKLTCILEEHIHSGECFEAKETEKTLTCTQEAHTHDENCLLDEDGNYSCGYEEHTHNEECYTYEEIPSGEGTTVTCGKEAHTHTDGCYDPDTATEPVPAEPDTTEPDSEGNTGTAHKHTDECYKTVWKLTCGKQGAHTHDENYCYDNSGNAVCGTPAIDSVETHVHDKDCFTADEEDKEYSKTYENEDIRVTAVYKKEADIPVEAKLDAKLIYIEESGLEEYKQLLDSVLAKDETPAVMVSLMFSTAGELIIPEDTISLTVEFLNDKIYTEGDMVKIAGVTGDGAEEIISAVLDSEHSVTFKVDELTDLAFIKGEENNARTLTYEGEDYIVTVVLDEETTVPEDAELAVEKITEESGPEAYNACYDRLKEAEGILEENDMPAVLLHMGIYAGDNEIVPDEAMEVTVQFLNHEVYFTGDEVKAAHLTEDGVELLAASAIDEEVSTIFTVNELAEFAFITDGDICTLTAEGEDFIVAVRFGPSARIPDDAKLVAKRITEESDPEQFAAREDQLQDEIEDEIIALGALFDIAFYDADGTEIEPQDVVDVKIQLFDKKDVEEADSVKVVHFVEDEETAEESIEIIEDADVSKDGEGSLSTTFQTESFSTYAIAIDGTVDSETTLRKAFKLVQENHPNGGSVTLQGDIVFGKVDGDEKDAIEIEDGSNLTLNLNGYTIAVTEQMKGSVTLFDIYGVLTITDFSDKGGSTVERKETYVSMGQSKSTDTENYTYSANYNSTAHHLNSVDFYVTESKPVDERSGATREELYKYTIAGHGAIVGSMENTSPLLYVPGGTLTLQGGVIVGGNGDRAIEARPAGTNKESTLNLKECYLIGNKATQNKEGNQPNGGAIYSHKGTINICNDGIVDANDLRKTVIISGNKAHQGGGIFAQDTIVNMNGGYITNNTSTFGKDLENYYGPGGGGMYLLGATVNMKGGYVTGNVAYAGGGGIALGGQRDIQRWVTKINSGTISSNYCNGYHGEGGGIALYDQSIIEINYKDSEDIECGPIYITNNQVNGLADWGGGGLFIGQNASATLFDTLITDNSAEGFGGGLGGCSTGRIVEANNSIRGAAIFDNSADGENYAGDSTKNADFTYTQTTPEFWERDQYGRYYFQDLFSVLFIAFENSMLGEGDQHWDGTVDGMRVNTNETFWQASYICGLTAFPSDGDKEKAKDVAHVYINGNHSAVHGGGIMCNGILVIGENKGQIEIITAMELTGTKKLLDGDGKAIDSKDLKAGQFTFTIYSGNSYLGQHTHDESCYVTIDNKPVLICGLEEGEPVFDNHEHKYHENEDGSLASDSCYKKIGDGSGTDAGGKGYQLICNKGIVATGKNGTEVIDHFDEETGIVTTTSYNPQTISFDSLLTFDLQRELNAEKKEDIPAGKQYTYWFYIKEDTATDSANNIEIERDRTVYCMAVTVEKKDYGVIGISNITKYYDDIVEIKLYKTIQTIQQNGERKWSWSDTPIKTFDQSNKKLHDDFHAIKINLDDFSDDKVAFTNKKTGIKRIEVRKNWNFDYGLTPPEGHENCNKEDEVEWVSVALFTKGTYKYYDEKYGETDETDSLGQTLEGQTKIRPGEMATYKGQELGRLYLTAANNWTASWENLPADFPIDDVEVREIDVKYKDEKWYHSWEPEKIDSLTLATRIEPAVWAFNPKYTYTTEGDIAKVVALNVPKTFGISFTKIGYTENGQIVGNSTGKNKDAVQGAVFEVYKWNYNEEKFDTEPLLFEQVNNGYSFIDEGVVTARRTVRQLTTNIDGEINISNLWWGKFLFKEVEAPVGYKPIHDHIIDYNGKTATEKVICVIDGKEIPNKSWTDPDTGVVTAGTEVVCPVFVQLASQINNDHDNGSKYFDYVDDVLKFTISDPEDKYELPETGGNANHYIGILGVVLFFGIAAVTYTTYRRRREGVRR